VIAEDVRRLRREGVSVTEISRRYGVAKSSISAVLKLHTYAPPEVIAVGLERQERALLRELAQDDRVSDEQLAAELIVKGMDRRILRQG
jgi:transposase-like protein